MARPAWSADDWLDNMGTDCLRLNKSALEMVRAETDYGLAARPWVPLTQVESPVRRSAAPYVAYLNSPECPRLPANTTEDELLAEVRALAKKTGWQCFHCHDSRHSEKGFPDLILTNGEDVLAYELKDNRRKPTADQERWLRLLEHTGKVETGVWRPRDWPEITERLTRRRMV